MMVENLVGNGNKLRTFLLRYCWCCFSFHTLLIVMIQLGIFTNLDVPNE